ncbi:MAG: hypothetical protein MZW92_36425 [Comamonadaceae bacterium]|nr:hypothetical protein [Comamonadaceae bacterium]
MPTPVREGRAADDRTTPSRALLAQASARRAPRFVDARAGAARSASRPARTSSEGVDVGICGRSATPTWQALEAVEPPLARGTDAAPSPSWPTRPRPASTRWLPPRWSR